MKVGLVCLKGVAVRATKQLRGAKKEELAASEKHKRSMQIH